MGGPASEGDARLDEKKGTNLQQRALLLPLRLRHRARRPPRRSTGRGREVGREQEASGPDRRAAVGDFAEGVCSLGPRRRRMFVFFSPVDISTTSKSAADAVAKAKAKGERGRQARARRCRREFVLRLPRQLKGWIGRRIREPADASPRWLVVGPSLQGQWMATWALFR